MITDWASIIYKELCYMLGHRVDVSCSCSQEGHSPGEKLGRHIHTHKLQFSKIFVDKKKNTEAHSTGDRFVL